MILNDIKLITLFLTNNIILFKHFAFHESYSKLFNASQNIH